MRKLIFLLVAILSLQFLKAQNGSSANRLGVFVDCSNTWCDMTFIRSEINLVDFLLDNQAADLHILITEQQNGGGGSQVQFIFFGQHGFRDMLDTIRFNIPPNATSFERRNIFLKYLKLGLAPFVARTAAAKDVMIEMKKQSGADTLKTDESKITKDPWNYWVFRVGTNGNVSLDENYRQSSLNGNFSVNRVTDELKIAFEFNASRNKSSFILEDSTGKQKIINRNDNYNFEQSLIKSINPHWSYGYELSLSHNSFSNNKSSLQFTTGIEYDIFPYKLVNSKLFTISYLLDVRRNAYIDTTLYDKTKETLWGHGLNSKITFNQKWGVFSFGLQYHGYLQNLKYFNLGAHIETDIRITGGLSFNMYTSAELTRDQLFLPKEGATSQEVLTRRRQLASGYNFYTYFGLSYRFGSKLNNFVNPRFD